MLRWIFAARLLKYQTLMLLIEFKCTKQLAKVVFSGGSGNKEKKVDY